MPFTHLHRYLLLSLALCLATTTLNAELLTFSFSDPVGDATGIGPDLIRFSGIIDNETGGYEFRLEATAERPFANEAGSNLIVFSALLNADIISDEAPHPGFYNGSYWPTMTSPMTVVIDSFVGSQNSNFKLWQAGHRIAVTDVLGPAPNTTPPAGPNFRVQVLASDRTLLGRDVLNPASFVVLQSVPEPSAFSLLGILTLSAVAFARRHR